MANLPQIGGIYQHYKNPEHLYIVLGFTKHSETNETLVTYYPLYDLSWLHEEGIDYSLGCSRPLDIWNEPVIIDGLEKVRFLPLVLDTPNDIDKLIISKDTKNNLRKVKRYLSGTLAPLIAETYHTIDVNF